MHITFMPLFFVMFSGLSAAAFAARHQPSAGAEADGVDAALLAASHGQRVLRHIRDPRSAGNVIKGEGISNATSHVTFVESAVSAALLTLAGDTNKTLTADADKEPEDDMQTSASTNIQHWINTLASEKGTDSSEASAHPAAVDPVVEETTSLTGEEVTTTTVSPHHPHHTAEEVADMNIDPYRNYTDEEYTGEVDPHNIGVIRYSDDVEDPHVDGEDQTHKNKQAPKDIDLTTDRGPLTGTMDPHVGTQTVGVATDAAKEDESGGAAEVTAILGGVLLGVALSGFLVLLIFRRLVKRFTRREILVEDEDMQHFEL